MELRKLIISIIDDNHTDKSKIRIIEEKEDNIIKLCGGLNGHGKWADYFDDLANLFKKFDDNGINIWITAISNDCLDDVFYITLKYEECQL